MSSHLRVVACVAFILWSLPACDAGDGGSETTQGGGSVDTGSSGGGDGTTGGGDGTTGGGTTAPADCTATATATLATDQGDLVYANATVAAVAKHMAGLGCVNELAIALAQGEGCALSLTLQTTDGGWTLSGGSLTVDAACGAGMDAAALGTYSLDVALSTGALGGTPTVSDAATAECIGGGALELKGLALFNGDGKTLEVNLNGLALTGDVLSSPVTAGSCPAEVATCPEQSCGSDAYGATCGSCGDGFACMEGECIVWNCPPEGPFGTHPGKSLTNVELHDCDGNSVWLHELCGADAAFFNLLAGW